MASILNSPVNIIVYRGWSGSGKYVWSPFVTKLEARFRFAGLPYRTEAGSMWKAPRGKIPYIAISNTHAHSHAQAAPTMLADTTLISQVLVEEGLLDNINASLSPSDKAHDLALRALLEDRLYWYQGYERWHENYYTMRSSVLSELPYPVQLCVGLLAYHKNMRTLYGQGTGRFTEGEIDSFKWQVWKSIDALLIASKETHGSTAGGKVFWVLGGNGPSEADTTLYGFIASALVCTAAPKTMKIIRSLPGVMDYAQRIHDLYFPDYTHWN